MKLTKKQSEEKAYKEYMEKMIKDINLIDKAIDDIKQDNGYKASGVYILINGKYQLITNN